MNRPRRGDITFAVSCRLDEFDAAWALGKQYPRHSERAGRRYRMRLSRYADIIQYHANLLEQLKVSP
jgi:hypothetical protein